MHANSEPSDTAVSRDTYLTAAGTANKAAQALALQADALEEAAAAYAKAARLAQDAASAAYQAAVLARAAVRDMDLWAAEATGRYLDNEPRRPKSLLTEGERANG